MCLMTLTKWHSFVQVSYIYSVARVLPILDVLLLLTEVALFCFRVPLVTHWNDSALCQVAHCHLLRWFCVVSGILFFLWDCLVPSDVLNCYSLHWFYIISGAPLSFTLMTINCPRCPTSFNWSVSASFQVYHFPSLVVVTYFTMCFTTATGVTLCQFRYTTIIHWAGFLFQVLQVFL